MMIQGVSIGEMINQSMTVLTKPSVASFEQYERRGGQREALTYMIAAAAVSGVVAMLFGLLGGVGGALVGLISGFIAPIVGFFVFSFLVYFVGKQQGGTGTQDEVFYSMSLFVAPIQAVVGAVSAIPILGCLALPVTLALGIYQIYLGYLAARASMNLNQNQAIITLVVAWLIQFVALLLVGFVVGLIAAMLGVAQGTLTVPTQ